jgi:uncharacterized protein
MVQRRTLLRGVLRYAASATLAAPALLRHGHASGVTPAPGEQSMASAWLVGGVSQVGAFSVNWQSGQMRLLHSHAVPSRAHGLLATPQGYWAFAHRPGRWFMHVLSNGQAQLHDTSAEPCTLNGHGALSAGGQWLYTSETDATTGQGKVGVRQASTGTLLQHWATHGLDPHQLLCLPDGSLLVANGGIERDSAGRKLPASTHGLDSSLVQLDGSSGRLLGQWRLADPHISLRHLALHNTPQGLQVGVALQAGHARPADRAAAPLLALWNGQALVTPNTRNTHPKADGYVGDIAAGPRDGFTLSAQKQGEVLWWQPGADFTVLAQLTQPCGLSATHDSRGFVVSAGRGLAHWHEAQAPRMQAWPLALAPDNHLISLG